MKLISAILAAVAISAMAFSTAMADCPTKGASAQNNTQKGISKDGTHAPLDDSANAKTQSGAASTGTTTSSEKTPQKSGDAMPMGTDKNQATSQQDVSAQQKGEKTAAAQADADKDC
ncbi:hypothetical protein [Phyllobacterium ifriqiyense]|uniref:hypothetical protein n=1 Tax=Phyllobacterium ifriqiyense TaxID=314238 RepID=UPI00339A2967